jgi:hypothetical protein
MRILLIAATALSCACANTAHNLPRVHGTPAQTAPAKSKGANAANGSLKSFKSERALRNALSEVRRLREVHRQKERERQKKDCLEWSKSLPQPIDCSKGMLAESITMSAAAARDDEDTNRQHQGIDEGGLVKKAGDVLVVLRRGRLFTIDTSGAQLATIDMADLATKDSPTVSSHDWYDELLVVERTVIVIGYSNARGGTEVVLFNLREGGRLEHRATYNLRSDDYYSGENYASRLVGGKLILYTTRPLPDEPDNLEWLPATRRSTPDRHAANFERIVSWDRVFRPSGSLGAFPTVHTMVTCDPLAVTFTCTGSVLLGAYLSVYYASPTAGYAWTQDWSGYPEGKPTSVVYRFAFDGSPISALQVDGEPSNQLAFLESDDAHLNVVVHRSEADDTFITSLLRVPLSAFGDGSAAAPTESYRELARRLDWFSIRFIGDFVLVGGASPVATNEPLIVAGWRSLQMFTLPMQHRVERVEAMGNDAIVIGPNEGNLGMTAISLAATPRVAATMGFEGARQSESRTHGFLYRAESAHEGVFGLPLLSSSATSEFASVVFMRNRHLSLSVAGRLDASETDVEDNCLVSCVDWYGNARAIFSGGRVFALIGYELIEARIGSDGRVGETRRLNFNPGARTSH